MTAKVERIDRNGSKHWIDHTCEKCDGTGGIEAYSYNEGGVCFLCGGTGEHIHRWVEHTEEYQKVVDARNAKKSNKKFFEKLGIEEGQGIEVVLGNTFDIKGELKYAGAHFAKWAGWYFTEKNDEYETLHIDFDDFVTCYTNGKYDINYDAAGIIQMKKDAVENAGNSSDFFGEIGDKIERKMNLIHEGGYETDYGFTCVYTFADEDGNQFVWKTTSAPDALLYNEWKSGTVRGTIKEHSEYRGIKQTRIIRCKLMD